MGEVGNGIGAGRHQPYRQKQAKKVSYVRMPVASWRTGPEERVHEEQLKYSQYLKRKKKTTNPKPGPTRPPLPLLLLLPLP